MDLSLSKDVRGTPASFGHTSAHVARNGEPRTSFQTFEKLSTKVQLVVRRKDDTASISCFKVYASMTSKINNTLPDNQEVPHVYPRQTHGKALRCRPKVPKNAHCQSKKRPPGILESQRAARKMPTTTTRMLVPKNTTMTMRLHPKAYVCSLDTRRHQKG